MPIWPKYSSSPSIFTRRSMASLIDSSRPLWILTTYQRFLLGAGGGGSATAVVVSEGGGSCSFLCALVSAPSVCAPSSAAPWCGDSSLGLAVGSGFVTSSIMKDISRQQGQVNNRDSGALKSDARSPSSDRKTASLPPSPLNSFAPRGRGWLCSRIHPQHMNIGIAQNFEPKHVHDEQEHRQQKHGY